MLIIVHIKQIKENEMIISNIQNYNNTSSYYVGYIEFLNRKIPLVYGTSAKELDQNIVGISEYSTSNHLILSGHAISSVFLPLYNIEIGDSVTVHLNENKKIYIIDEIKIVNKKDISVYDNNGLTLITCVNTEQRLIVHAKTAHH